MEKVKILVLGGLDEEGKGLYVIDVNNDIFVIGAGFKYPSKSTPGIDFIISDFSYLVENKDRVKAFILPKCKKNSFGAMPYIYQQVKAPIYCTELTKYHLEKFTKQYKQEVSYEFKTFTLPASIKISNHFVTFFATCASMPSTFGLAIKTELGNIVFSSDFIIEYGAEEHFRVDLNTLGKIAEKPTLVLMSESLNALKPGYCSPNHRIYPRLIKYLHNSTGRVFIALNSDNLYHIDETFRACKEFNKKICFYDEESLEVYNLMKMSNFKKYNYKNILRRSDIASYNDNDVVILICDEKEKLYEKVSLLANNEIDIPMFKIKKTDTFYLASIPSDNNEIIATNTIDELYKTGCNVYHENKNTLEKMHAHEEDLKMLISLLNPKYYFPIEGYYVSLLANAKMAFEMGTGLNHNSIFLLDNGQSITFNETSYDIDFNENESIKVGDVMIDGIGVGDVVNEIISERNRLGEDGVVVLGCVLSKEKEAIIAGPDIQMRGFLFLKDKDAEIMLKEIEELFINIVSKWIKDFKDKPIIDLEEKIESAIFKLLLKNNNRNPVVKPNIIIV